MTVVCSGYFNPLHVGHLDYLEEASKFGSLIVIVNNDKQVRLKGRVPFFNQLERQRIIESVCCVDRAVVAIDEDDSIAETLRSLNPNIFFNAGDREISNINPKELDVCDSNGIIIIYGTNTKVQSSSELIEKATQWINKK